MRGRMVKWNADDIFLQVTLQSFKIGAINHF